VLLVPHSGAGLGIAGAGLALCGAYAAMLVAMYLLTRRLFKVGFEWRRLAHLTVVLAGVAVSGELLLPTHGAAGCSRASPGSRLVRPRCCSPASSTRTSCRRRGRWWPTAARVAAFRARHGDVEAYAEDPLRTSDPDPSHGTDRARPLQRPSLRRGLYSSAASRSPSPAPGRSVAPTWRQ